ncbi:MAG: integrin alpha [Planctomycetota bacterium JB042]
MRRPFPILLVVALGSLPAEAGPPAPPADPSSEWLDAVQDDIRRAEYDVTSAGERAHRATNRAQRFDVRFSADGLRIAPGPGSDRDFEWRLSLRGLGRGDALETVSSPELAVEGNRVEYRRGDVVEWYVNDARGVEQGFTLSRRPGGAADARVVVDLAVSGPLAARSYPGGIEYRDADGAAVVRYAKLHVVDANGRELPSAMTSAPGAIRLEVDDRDARYPIVIDPLVDNPAWEVEGGTANGQFGFSVATAGDLDADGYSDVIVGAPFFNNVGQVRIFLGDANGLPTVADLTLNGSAASGEFGYSVATAGDVDGDGRSDIVIGVRAYTGAITGQGRAEIYRGSSSGSVLAFSPYAQLTIAQTNAFFGTSVSTAGDVNGDGFSDVIVGAPRAEQGTTREGLAYVFHGGASMSPTPSATLEANDDFANFGFSVSTAGDVDADGFSDVIVGAPNYNAGQVDEGFAAIHHGSSGGVATTAEWTKDSNFTNARFGYAVGTAGDVNGDGFSDVVVGSPGFTTGPVDEGWAFVYHGSPGTASVAPNWQDQGNGAGALYGAAVGTAGDVNGDGYADLAIGSPGFDGPGSVQGQVFVHHGSAGGLSTEPDFLRALFEANPAFGNAVATAGDVNGDGFSDVIFGARTFTNGQTNEGRAQVHYGSPAGPGTMPVTFDRGDSASRRLGSSVASAGDVNGDGFADWIAGEPTYSNGDESEGRALVYHGGITHPNAGTTSTPAWTFESDNAFANLGVSVSTAGDLNGDGYSDVIVGAPKATAGGGQPSGGAIYTFLGSAAGLSPTPSFVGGSIQSDSDLGYSVSVAGDVNGDGFCDIIFGAPLRDAGEVDEGQAFVYLGSPNAVGLSGVDTWADEGDQAGARFGFSVSSAGDVDGDGFSDVLVGAPGYDVGTVDAGRTFYYFGSAAGLSTTPASSHSGNNASGNLGFSVSEAGDFNADGYTDAVVGEPFTGGGRAHVLRGEPGLSLGFVPVPIGSTIQGVGAQARLGTSVSDAGDVNADGFADVIAGAPGTDGSGANGYASIHFGSMSGPQGSEIDKLLLGTVANGLFGRAVSTAGDVNGDGYADVVVGAPEFDDASNASAGTWTLHLGNDAPVGTNPLAARPRQRRGNDAGPIPRLGITPIDTFRIEMLGRTPFGRGKVRLRWELSDAAGALVASGVGDPTDTGKDGTMLFQAPSSLAEGLYSWRARVVHDKATTPFLPAGPWLTMPWNGGTEADLRVKYVPSNLTVDSGAPISVTHELKTAPPAAVVRTVTNIGGFPLDWTATPSAPWVTVSPAAGGGVVAGDPGTNVSIGFDPSKLVDGVEVGTHTATVRFENANDPSDAFTISVEMTAAYKMFVPGDTLVGQIDGPLDSLGASSEGFVGMKLPVTLSGATEKMKLLVTVQGGGKAKTKKVTVKPGKTKKLTLKLKSDGLYGVTIRSTKGVGPLQIQTGLKLSKPAKPATVTLTSKSPTAIVRVLPGATLSGAFLPNGKFAGPLSLTVRNPENVALDTAAFQQPAGNGGLALQGLPLPLAGTYSLQIGGNGFGSKKAKVAVTLTPTQPPLGSSVIVLP